MSEIPDFSDREAVEAWFKTQPRQVGEAVAARAALRVFPAVPLERAFTDLGQHTTLTLAVLRAGLVSAAAATCPATEAKVREDLRSAANSAAASANSANSAAASAYSAARSAASTNSAASAANSANSAAASAASAARSAASTNSAAASDASAARSAANSAAYSAARYDASQAAEDVRAEFGAKLWPDEADIATLLEGLWLDFRKQVQQVPIWDFWLRWYQAIWDGKPLDWALTRAVALIDDDVWKAGPEAVAEAIREIEARFVATTLAERVEFSATGRLTLVPQPSSTSPTVGRLMQTLEDTLDDATSDGRNFLTDDSYQVRLLRRTLARYGNDPQRIEMDVERARASLLQDIADDTLPASAGNRDLIQTLEDIGGALRLDDPEIAKNRERLNRIRLGNISQEDGRKIEAIAVEVAAISEDVLKEDLLEDRYRLPGVSRNAAVPDPVVPIGAAERNSTLEAQAAQLRVASRLSRVWLFLKENNVEIGLVGSLASIIGLLIALVV